MPDTRSHRGAHPKDAGEFSARQLPTLRTAVDDLCWLLSRGYPETRSLVLVGDRYTLRERQRKAVGRVAASDQAVASRAATRLDPDQMAGRRLDLDGYNVLLTVEAALGGGILLPGRDQTLRDMAAMSRHYKKVQETRDALRLIGSFLEDHGAREVCWYLDRPISNSGRLRGLMLDIAEQEGWPWTVELVPNPDPVLKESEHVIVSADSAILDVGGPWVNLARHVVEPFADKTWWVEI